MSKFFDDRATTEICAKKPVIVIECKILTTHKKSKQMSLLAGQKHATFYTLVCENIWTSLPITVNEKLKIYGENGENQSQMNSNEVIKGFDCSK